jgi:hypothetical protein
MNQQIDAMGLADILYSTVNKRLQLVLLLLLLAELLSLPLLMKASLLLLEPQQLQKQLLVWLLPQPLNLLFQNLSYC